MNFADPNGENPLVTAFFGGVIGMVGGAADAAYHGESSFAGIWAGAGKGALIGAVGGLTMGWALPAMGVGGSGAGALGLGGRVLAHALAGGAGDIGGQTVARALDWQQEYDPKQTACAMVMAGAYGAAAEGAAILGDRAGRPSTPNIVKSGPQDPLVQLRPPAKAPGRWENWLIYPKEGLQSSKGGLFKDVKLGTHGEKGSAYLWTIDNRGVNIALEKTPFATARGNIVHSNISREASIAGEAWFTGPKQVTINAGSGRFGYGSATIEQWDAAIALWKSLGYEVNAIPFGQR